MSRLHAEPEGHDPDSEVAVSDVAVRDHVAHRGFDRLDRDAEGLMGRAAHGHRHGKTIEVQYRSAFRGVSETHIEQQASRQRGAAPRSPRPRAQAN